MPMLYLCIVLFFLSVAVCFISPERRRKPSANGRLLKYSTDSVKGIAIIGIFLSHVIFYAELGGVIRHLEILGGLGVSVFFSLSGYGNSFSVEKNNHCIKWVVRKTMEVVIPFLLSFAFVFLCSALCTREKLMEYGSVYSLLTLTIPGTTTWYLKIQILCYLIVFLGRIVFREQYYLAVVFCSIVYVVIVSQFLPDFWWQTLLCFAFGILWRRYREKHTIPLKIYYVAVLAVLSAFSLIAMMKLYGTVWLHCLTYLIFAVFVMEAAYALVPQNRIVAWVGRKSLPIYLIHIGLCPMLISQESNLTVVIPLVCGLTFLGTVVVDWSSGKIIAMVSHALRLGDKC